MDVGPAAVAAEAVSITAAGRRFHGCTVLHFPGSAGWGFYRWFCPGVGYVRTEMYTCNTVSQYIEVHELMSLEQPR